MELCIFWELPSPPIGDPNSSEIIIEKPCIEGAEPMGNYAY